MFLNWESGETNPTTDVKFFDNEISKFLVEKDQINRFEISHLKSEYFSFLHQLYDEIAINLQKKLENATSQELTKKEIVEKSIPSFFESGRMISKEEIIGISYSDTDRKLLAQTENKIKVLERSDVEPIIKNLGTATKCVLAFLNAFGLLEITSDKDRQKQIEAWKLKYSNEYFEEINQKIEDYSSAKQAFEASGSGKLSNLIPDHWIKQGTWNKFIESSIEFLNSLEQEEKTKYTKKICAYCHQSLQTQEAKHLINIYQQMREEHETKLESVEKELQSVSDTLNSAITELNGLQKNKKIIESEFKHLGRSDKIKLDLEKLKKVIITIKTAVDNTELIEINLEDSLLIQETWDYFEKLNDDFIKVTKSLTDSLENRQQSTEVFREQLSPLKHRRDLVVNKKNILEYFKYEELTKEIKDKLSDISAIRQVTSRLATKFSQEVPLAVFKKNLKKEYENFDFVLPEVWELRTSTRGEETKRVYSLRDKKLSEIFSEGERKIHALADFFAQCQTNEYKGVFIFDDPVNSLDDENIEVVRKRILNLVEDGNQVIVFTHNQFFLYSLIEHNYEKEKINKLERLTSSIYLETEIQVGKENELKKVFDEMKKRMKGLSNKPEQDLSEYELREVYNLMSGYLETYVEVKLFKEIVTRYRPNIRMHSLERFKEVDFSIIDDLIDLYAQTSRKGSRHSQPLPAPAPKYPELVKDFEHLKHKYLYKSK